MPTIAPTIRENKEIQKRIRESVKFLTDMRRTIGRFIGEFTSQVQDPLRVEAFMRENETRWVAVLRTAYALNTSLKLLRVRAQEKLPEDLHGELRTRFAAVQAAFDSIFIALNDALRAGFGSKVMLWEFKGRIEFEVKKLGTLIKDVCALE